MLRTLPRPTRRFPFALLATLVLAAACAGPARGAPPAKAAPAASSGEEAATRSKLAAVRAQIARIAREQRTTAARRQSINAQLAEQASSLDRAANALHETDAAIVARSDALADLESRRAQLDASLASQRSALAELLRAAYTIEKRPDVALLLGDGDVSRINRALAYSHYFQRDRMARIHALTRNLADLDQLEQEIRTEAAALQAQRRQRAARVQELKQARDARQALLAKADAELAHQKSRLKGLQQDAEALDQLLKQLENVFTDIPPEAGRQTAFAKLRGRLPLPVAGHARADPDTAGGGIVIPAPAGTAVHAVAYGRVAWANFMRGFGMLVILDHGDGWMSLYGGNESLRVHAGDWVNPGQVIATLGRNPPQGGAWFGLRHDGKPVDPAGWLASRR